MTTRPCAVPLCVLDAEIRGFCKTHYQWARRHGLKARVTLPMRIVDVLETDGCWLTIEAIAAALPGHRQEAVARAIHRLGARGELQSRPVPGARRREWQLT